MVLQLLAEPGDLDVAARRRGGATAEAHADEDRRLRDLAEARNEGENAAYQAEKQVKDLGEAVDDASKEEIEQRIKELREALAGEDSADITAKTDALQTAFHKVSEAMYEQAQAKSEAAAAANGGDPAAAVDSEEEDVVDAEVVDEGR